MPVDTEFCFEGMKCHSYTNQQLRLPEQILNEFLWNVSQDNGTYLRLYVLLRLWMVMCNAGALSSSIPQASG